MIEYSYQTLFILSRLSSYYYSAKKCILAIRLFSRSEVTHRFVGLDEKCRQLVMRQES